MQFFRNFGRIFITSLIFVGINFILQTFVYSQGAYNNLNNILAISNPNFWFSSPGIGLRVLIDMSVVSLLLFCCSLLMPKRITFRIVSKAVSYAYLIFLLQMMIEAVLIKAKIATTENERLEEFSFLSVFYFGQKIGLRINPVFHYLTQTISIFEIMFWILLTLGLYHFAKIRLSNSVILVSVGYILPLFIWLLSLSFFALINLN
jgi:hypothetical protein